VKKWGVLILFLGGLFTALLLTSVRDADAPVSATAELTAEEILLFAEDDAASFGEDDADVAPASAVEQLLAIRETVNGRSSEALITSAGSTRYYVQGEHLPGSLSELVNILDNAVLLRKGTAYELLCCAAESSAGHEKYVAPSILDLRAETASTLAARRYHTRLFQNPLSLLGKVKVETVDSNGNRHYRVFPGSDPKAFADFGLKAGDTVVGVNGIALTDKKAIPKLFGALTSASHIAVTLQRDGRELVVLLALDESFSQSELLRRTSL
jgi:type II secretion system protein C